jgi:hypothetical protein
MSSGSPLNKRFLFLLGLLAAAFLLWYVINKEEHNWAESYALEEQNPYDLWLFKQLLEQAAGEKLHTINASLDTSLQEIETPAKSTYILAGGFAHFTPSEVEALTTFAENGGKIFILAANQSYDLLENIWGFSEESDSTAFEKIYDVLPFTNTINATGAEIIAINEGSDSARLHITKLNKNAEVQGEWSYFEPLYINDSALKISSLGLLADSLVNYVMLPRGKGWFYLHTCPMGFSNYYLRQEAGLKYAQSCLSFIDIEDNIYWDTYSMNDKYDAENIGGSGDGEQANLPEDGPLSFVLSQRELRMAWYVLVVGSILFLLAGMKRKQRAIPLVLPRENSSLGFARTLSDLYIVGRNHSKISKLQWKMFKNMALRNYGIRVEFANDTERNEIVSRLAIRSGIKETAVEAIFSTYLKIMVSERVDNRLLVEFNGHLQHFYKHAK